MSSRSRSGSKSMNYIVQLSNKVTELEDRLTKVENILKQQISPKRIEHIENFMGQRMDFSPTFDKASNFFDRLSGLAELLKQTDAYISITINDRSTPPCIQMYMDNHDKQAFNKIMHMIDKTIPEFMFTSDFINGYISGIFNTKITDVGDLIYTKEFYDWMYKHPDMVFVNFGPYSTYEIPTHIKNRSRPYNHLRPYQIILGNLEFYKKIQPGTLDFYNFEDYTRNLWSVLH